MRLVVARCSVDYVGRLTAHLPPATRVLMVKADNSVLVHSDGGSYKPLNWMSPPCWLVEEPGRWTVQNKAGEQLVISLDEVLHDSRHDLGVDPGLVKDGVEAHLQILLAEHVATLGERLVAGPPGVPDADRPGRPDVPRRGRRQRGGRDQAPRRDRRRGAADPLPGTAQPGPDARPGDRRVRRAADQAAGPDPGEDRGIRCVVLDYEALQGRDGDGFRLF